MWESKHLAFVSHEMVSVILKSVDSSKDDSLNGAGMMTGVRGPLWDRIMAMRIDSTSDSGMLEFLAYIIGQRVGQFPCFRLTFLFFYGIF